MPSNWLPLNRSRPCPVCELSSRCSIHISGTRGWCRTPEANEGREPFLDSSGQASWAFTLGSLAGREHTPLIQGRECGNEDILGFAYEVVLRCGCGEPHLRDLCKRYGVVWEARHTLPLADYASIDRLDVDQIVRTLLSHLTTETLLTIPGFYQTDTGKIEFVPRYWKRNGLLIACRNPKGTATALKARLDVALPGGDRYLMVSSLRHGGAGPKSSIHFPDIPKPTDTTIRLTEGEIKANVATYWTDLLTLSLPGVHSWRQFLPALRKLVDVRQVLLAFDSDIFWKPQVARALHELLDEIWSYNNQYEVGIEVWGKQHKGIDDLLVAGLRPTLYTGEQAYNLYRQIGQVAGLELESEQFSDIVSRIRETNNPLVLTEPTVQRFAASLADTVRYRWNMEVREVLGTRYRQEAFWRAVAGLERDRGDKVEGGGEGRLPAIETYSRATSLISADAAEAIYRKNDPPRIFYWGNSLARLEQPTHGANYEVALLGLNQLKAELERVAEWYRTPADKVVRVACPENTVKDLLSYPEAWNGLPRVEGTVCYPVFDREGRLVDKPGYNPSSGMVYNASNPVELDPLPEKVDEKDIRKARGIIEDLLGDFRLEKDYSKAYAWSLFLLQPARWLINDNTPMHLINAPRPAVGKGKLYSVLTRAWVPQEVPRTPAPSNDSEWDKRLLAALTRSSTHLLFDNVSRRVDSDALALALTGRTYSSRILGVSRMAEVPINCIWAMTGNNVSMSSEIRRRTVPIQLESNEENPSLRRNFTYPDILGHVDEKRAEIIWAGLVMVKAWLDAGRPDGKQILGSYEVWSRVMGGILDVCGIPGFLTDDRSMEGEEEHAAQAEFVYSWWLEFQTDPVLPEKLQRCCDGMDLGFHEDFRGENLPPDARLPRILSKMRGLVFSGRKVTSAPKGHGRSRYCIEIVKPELHEKDVAQREAERALERRG